MRPFCTRALLACVFAALGACAQGQDVGTGQGGSAGAGGSAEVTSGEGAGVAGTGGSEASTSGGSAGATQSPHARDVIFVELMIDPAELSDFDAEWFEVMNVSSEAVTLESCHLEDTGTNGDDVLITASVTLAPSAIALFAKVSDPGKNGGLPEVAYAFGDGFSLTNTGDEVQLVCDGELIDEVTYTAEWPYAPGASMELAQSGWDAVSNDASANWCTSSTMYFDSERGSPGTVSSHCR